MRAFRLHTLLATALVALLPALACAGFGGFKIDPPKIDLPKPPKIDVPKPPKIDIPKPPDLSHLDPVKRAEKELENARRDALKDLRKFSPDDVLANVRRSLSGNLSKAEARLGVSYNQQTGELDLRNSKPGKTLNSWLEKFAQGNERKGQVERFSYNVRTERLEVRLMARHHQRQNWGPLGHVNIYDCTQRASFRYDFRKGDADFDIDLGPLAPRINMRAAKALAKGDLVAAAEAAAPDLSAVIRYERTNDYDRKLREYQQRYGRDNVYMSSRAFVEWAGSQSIGKYAATGVLSGGTAVWPQIMKDAEEMARKELPGITSWLERLGQKDARKMAEQLISGRTPRWPFLKFEMIVVPHHSREVNPQTGVKTPWRHFNNLGFILVFQPR